MTSMSTFWALYMLGDRYRNSIIGFTLLMANGVREDRLKKDVANNQTTKRTSQRLQPDLESGSERDSTLRRRVDRQLTVITEEDETK
jgi:hypothetical protein